MLREIFAHVWSQNDQIVVYPHSTSGCTLSPCLLTSTVMLQSHCHRKPLHAYPSLDTNICICLDVHVCSRIGIDVIDQGAHVPCFRGGSVGVYDGNEEPPLGFWRHGTQVIPRWSCSPVGLLFRGQAGRREPATRSNHPAALLFSVPPHSLTSSCLRLPYILIYTAQDSIMLSLCVHTYTYIIHPCVLSLSL